MKRFLKYTVQAPGLVLGIFLAAAAVAEAQEQPREFEIELLVFKHLVENDAGEIWPIDYDAWFEEEMFDEETGAATGEATPPEHAPPAGLTWLPRTQYRLTAERNALGRSSGYRPLAWFAWRQPVLDRQQATAVELSSEAEGSGKAWVDGSVRVAVERYLHLYLDLQLHEALDSAQLDSLGYDLPEIRLVERRRMRSREIHYFDNPRFGVIALITPYEPPQEAPEAGLPADAPVPP